MKLDTIRKKTEAFFNQTGQRYAAVHKAEGAFETVKWEKEGDAFQCRLVEKTTSGKLQLGSQITFEAKILYPYNVPIPMGSRLTVDGVAYRLSGKEKVYLSHREAFVTSVQQFS
ncbi:MAG: hypothetical protein KHZ62_02135 [Clostridiales bacterium]|nr:hypothetical protein [Clostridiales bacterium]